MRSLLMLLAATLLSGTLAAGPQPASLCEDSDDYKEAATTILCDCGCHPQSVHACACGRAAEMRNDVCGMVLAGMTGTEVVDDYVAKNGEQIRIAPTADGFNLVAWVGPLVGLFGASGVLFLLLRRWSGQRPDVDPDEPAAAPDAVDDAYRKRLQTALENFE